MLVILSEMSSSCISFWLWNFVNNWFGLSENGDFQLVILLRIFFTNLCSAYFYRYKCICHCHAIDLTILWNKNRVRLLTYACGSYHFIYFIASRDVYQRLNQPLLFIWQAMWFWSHTLYERTNFWEEFLMSKCQILYKLETWNAS